MREFEHQSESDREWLAFRYIAGELSAEEAAKFEAELEMSQGSREAVARAVKLSQLVNLAQAQEVELVKPAAHEQGSPRKSWMVRVGWIGAGGVAASVAGLVWWSSQVPKAETPELAEIWTESRAVEPPLATPEVSPIELSPVLDAAELVTAPSWMTAGVISQGGGKVEDDDEMVEN